MKLKIRQFNENFQLNCFLLFKQIFNFTISQKLLATLLQIQNTLNYYRFFKY